MKTKDNSLELKFHWATDDKTIAEVRANALFIYGKLVAAGVSIPTAKEAVENLFAAGHSEGYDEAAYLYSYQPD